MIYTNKWNVSLKCSRFRSPEAPCCCPLLLTLCKPPCQLVYTITGLSKPSDFCIVSIFKARSLNFSATKELHKKNGVNINNIHKTTHITSFVFWRKIKNLANIIDSHKNILTFRPKRNRNWQHGNEISGCISKHYKERCNCENALLWFRNLKKKLGCCNNSWLKAADASFSEQPHTRNRVMQ